MDPHFRFLRSLGLGIAFVLLGGTVACTKTNESSQKNFVAALGDKNRHLVVWPAYAAADAKAFVGAVSSSKSFQEVNALMAKPEFASFVSPELCWYGRDVPAVKSNENSTNRKVLAGDDLRTIYTRKDPALSTQRSVSCPSLMKAMGDNPKLAKLATRLKAKALTAGVKDPCTYLLYVLTPQLGPRLFAGLQAKGIVTAQEGGLP